MKKLIRRHIPLFIVALLLTSSWASAAIMEVQSLVSVGSGFIVRTADMAVISFAIESTAPQGGAAQQLNQDTIQKITTALLQEDLPGLSYEIRQASFWESTSLGSKEKNYKVSAGLDIRINDIDQVGRVVDIGLANGAASIQDVRFELSDLEAVARDALDLAVKDAIEKANLISQAAGLRITMVREMRDANTIRVHNPSSPTSASVRDAALPPLAGPVYRGQILVHAEVTIVFDMALDRSQT